MSDHELGIMGLGAMDENLAKPAVESDVDVVGMPNPSDATGPVDPERE